jgi:release factor glutamine methyltransferase
MANARTAADLLHDAAQRLKRSPAIDHWPADREVHEARVLLAFVLGLEEDEVDERGGVPAARARRFDTLVRRRAGGEPMAHILGWTEFRGLRIRVRPGAFVPRQSSEFTVEQAARRLRGKKRPIAVDVATGIGPIALAIGAAVPKAEVHGTDISGEAIRQARANARDLGLRNVEFHRGDMFGSLPDRIRGKVDVLTAHAPYVPKGEVADLPLEVRGFEPEDTLTDHSEHGMGLLTKIAEEAPEWLRPNGWVLLEVSPDFARAVRGLLVRHDYRDVKSTKGWPEVTRVIIGRP